VAQQFLLDSAADLFHRLQAEPHDVECVQHGDGVVEFVADGVGVATEWIQCRDADLAAENVPVGTQPIGIDLADRPITRSSSRA
jgi:hypothetical protein